MASPRSVPVASPSADERVTVIEPVPRPAVADAHATLLAAMRSPLDRAPLRDLVRSGQRVAISVCDITRAQPRTEMLRALFEEMPQISALERQKAEG